MILNDTYFRYAFFILFSFLLVIRGYYKIKARQFQFKPIVKSEGLTIFIIRSLLGVPLLVTLFFYIFQPQKDAFLEVNLSVWLRMFGFLLGILSLFLLVWTHHSLGKNFNTSIMVRKDHELVKRGPYQWIRHPMYIAYFVLFFAAFLVTGNWGISASGLLVILVLMTLRLIKEEFILVKHFGKEYKEYMERVGKFIPRRSK